MGIKAPTTIVLVMTSLLRVEASVVTEDLLVNTTTGTLQGGVRTLNGTTIYNWLGVPYAEPPTGGNRFKRPKSKTPWYGIRNATEQPNICYQSLSSTYSVLKGAGSMWNMSGNMSEDCLYLNILKPSSGEEKYSTIVWIHGGTFQRGSASASLYDPAHLVTEGDVIVVSVQYRVGPLGFLGLNNSHIPGNMGLLDQAEALKWVKTNIDAFGGDKDDITLMGQSSGAASVGLHMISNMTRDSFTKVILQSGGPFSYWSYIGPSELMVRSMMVVNTANCTRSNPEEVYKCLMSISPEVLTAADKSPLNLAPTIDKHFLHKSPLDAVMENDFIPIPVLGGIGRSEGMPAILTVGKRLGMNFSNISSENYETLVGVVALYLDVPPASVNTLASFYAGKCRHMGSDMYREAAIQLFGDIAISCPAIDFMRNVTGNSSRLFFYHFNHRSPLDIDPSYTGVIHGAEVPFVFGRPFKTPENYTDEDRTISDFVIGRWTSFARNGYPTGIWKQRERGDELFLKIRGKSDNIAMLERDPFCSEIRKYADYNNITLSAKRLLTAMRRIRGI